jgi:hypothetical protein
LGQYLLWDQLILWGQLILWDLWDQWHRPVILLALFRLWDL